jgi:hypothetical protein
MTSCSVSSFVEQKFNYHREFVDCSNRKDDLRDFVWLHVLIIFPDPRYGFDGDFPTLEAVELTDATPLVFSSYQFNENALSLLQQRHCKTFMALCRIEVGFYRLCDLE